MKDVKPIKRSKQLVPLSHEHHDTLLFIWKIKQGLKNKTSVEIMSNYIQWFWQTHIKEHFDKEETLLLPHLAGNELGHQLKKEHETIRSLMMHPANETSISLLMTSLDDHIRFEERRLFGFIEKELSADELDKIFTELGHAEHGDCEWGNEFWTSEKNS